LLRQHSARTDATIPYTLHVMITDVLTVPGSFEAGTETVTGDAANYTVRGIGAVLLNAGRIITRLPDLTLEFTAGPQGFWNYFLNGDSSVMQELCAALGA
jgi:hypothetical protein